MRKKLFEPRAEGLRGERKFHARTGQFPRVSWIRGSRYSQVDEYLRVSRTAGTCGYPQVFIV